MKSIFREYDIRGIFKKELNEKSVKAIGYFLGKKITEHKAKASVAIGYDARTHSLLLQDWLTSGFNKAGVMVLDMGLVPTPVNYFSGYQQFDDQVFPSATVMITGSHNPPEYNGFKITLDNRPFFGEDIYALGKEIENNLDMDIEDNFKKTKIDAKERYIRFIVNHFKELKNMKGRYVFDCGNGAVGVVLEEILTKLNIDAKLLYCKPDGTFPNHHPDPSEEENLQDLKDVLTKEGDFGFAFDGDGDRLAVLSKKYNFKGDILAIFFAKNITNPIVIGEVKCSQIMYDEINEFGVALMHKTGHSNLKVKIAQTKASFAAEVSGHLFFNDRYYGFDDAIYATFRALELIKNGFDFDKEYEKLPKVYSTDELKVKTTEDKKFKIIVKLKELLKNPPANFPQIKNIIDIDGVRVIFENGWALVRASNTTPVLVTRFEATSQKELEIIQDEVSQLLQKAMDEV